MAEGFWVETWTDGYGTFWDLVVMGDGDCMIRQGYDSRDRLDGDVREGVDVIARFGDAESGRSFLWSEGFEPL